MPTTYLCDAKDVPLNGCKRISRGRHPALAVFNLDGHFFVTDDKCTHGNASLCAGEVEDGEVVCPLHFGAFDIRTGKPVEAPCDVPLRTYRVDVRDGKVHYEAETP